jgi:hypothetical protein
VEGGVGEFSVEGGTKLATAEGRSPYDPRFDVERTGGTADVWINLGSGSFGPSTSGTRLDVTLDKSVVWDLDIKCGVSHFDVDLSDIVASSLAFEAGVSGGTLTLGAPEAPGGRNAVKGTIEAGISTLKIRVPAGESVRVKVNGGLTALNVDGSWESTSNGGDRTYESDGFSDRGAYWDIVIDAGIGTINIEYY